MKRLHAFILKEFLGPLLLTFFIVTFLLLMQFLWKYIDDLVGKGLNMKILAELMFYTAASFIPMALPLAILLASLMTFGNMGENYELTALKAAGISLIRILKPLIIFMVFLSVGAFFYSNISLPFFNLKMRSLIHDIQQQRPELQIKEGVFYNGLENYSIRIGKKDAGTNLLHNIKIYDHTSQNGNVQVTVADSGYIRITEDKQMLVLTLFKGDTYIEADPNKENKSNYYPMRHDKFDQQDVNISLSGFGLVRSDEDLFKNNYQMMNLSQLKQSKDSLVKDLFNDQMLLKTSLVNTNFRNIKYFGQPDTSKIVKPSPVKFSFDSIYNSLNDFDKRMVLGTALNSARNVKSTLSSESDMYSDKKRRMRKHEIEWHKKFTLSIACVIFFFIGAPLGAIIRKGGIGMPLVISVLFFVVYYIISLSGEKFVRESILPAYKGVWIASAILLPIGVFLTYKATNDASFMNADKYRLFINKIFDNKAINFIFRKKTKK